MLDNVKEEVECLICIEPNMQQAMVTIQRCCHMLCRYCLTTWSIKNPICPLDRQEITELMLYTNSSESRVIISLDLFLYQEIIGNANKSIKDYMENLSNIFWILDNLYDHLNSIMETLEEMRRIFKDNEFHNIFHYSFVNSNISLHNFIVLVKSISEEIVKLIKGENIMNILKEMILQDGDNIKNTLSIIDKKLYENIHALKHREILGFLKLCFRLFKDTVSHIIILNELCENFKSHIDLEIRSDIQLIILYEYSISAVYYRKLIKNKINHAKSLIIMIAIDGDHVEINEKLKLSSEKCILCSKINDAEHFSKSIKNWTMVCDTCGLLFKLKIASHVSREDMEYVENNILTSIRSIIEQLLTILIDNVTHIINIFPKIMNSLTSGSFYSICAKRYYDSKYSLTIINFSTNKILYLYMFHRTLFSKKSETLIDYYFEVIKHFEKFLQTILKHTFQLSVYENQFANQDDLGKLYHIKKGIIETFDIWRNAIIMENYESENLEKLYNLVNENYIN